MEPVTTFKNVVMTTSFGYGRPYSCRFIKQQLDRDKDKYIVEYDPRGKTNPRCEPRSFHGQGF